MRKHESRSFLPDINNNYELTAECQNSHNQQCWDKSIFKKQADSTDNILHGPILLHTQDYSSITTFIFTSCEWISCEGGIGGGIYTTKSGSTLKVISCYFHDCYAENDFGGGIAAEHLDNVYIYLSTFAECHGIDTDNTNSGGGAVFLNDTQQLHQIHDCDFIGCYSGADGGAFHLRNSKVMQTDGVANTRFINCKTLLDGTGVEGGAGQSASVEVTCSFSNSLICACCSSNGGGFYLHVKEDSSTNLMSFCFFHDNIASGHGNDLGLGYFSRDIHNRLIIYSISTSSESILFKTDGEWYSIDDDDWLPQGDM